MAASPNDYAAHMSNLQFRFTGYRFRPTVFGTLLMLCSIPLFIKFGFWQYTKAEQKLALQAMHDKALTAAPVELPLELPNAESWRYRQVMVSGKYVPEYQILLDNQVVQERAGYHVITPLRISNSARHVLVDRGWVAASADRQLPVIKTPPGEQQVKGHVWLPSNKFYSLEDEHLQTNGPWQLLWQNMDMPRYRQAVPLETLPVIVRLDPDSEAGGFLRVWPKPAERITTHIGYAYQWFGFALAALFIWIFVSFKRQGKT